MTSLYRTGQASQEGLKNSTTALGVKNLNIRTRNYSNSRPNLQLPIDLQIAKHTIDSKIRNQHTSSTNNSKQFKKYCLNKLKQSTGTEKFNAIRKNRSLKVMAKDHSNLLIHRSKVEPSSSEDIFVDKQVKSQAEDCKLISIKRRVQLIKKNQDKRKLVIKHKESQWSKDLPKSDISLGEGLDFFFPEHEKINISSKIQSENVLGEALKKFSSTKIRILVKNPFQKFMRLEQYRQRQKQANPAETSIEELHQSQIAHKMDQTTSTFSNRCELEEMLALI